MNWSPTLKSYVKTYQTYFLWPAIILLVIVIFLGRGRTLKGDVILVNNTKLIKQKERQVDSLRLALGVLRKRDYQYQHIIAAMESRDSVLELRSAQYKISLTEIKSTYENVEKIDSYRSADITSYFQNYEPVGGDGH